MGTLVFGDEAKNGSFILAKNDREKSMNSVFLLLTLLIFPVAATPQDAIKRDEHQMHRLHRDPKAYIGALKDPKRDAYQKPHEVLTALGMIDCHKKDREKQNKRKGFNEYGCPYQLLLLLSRNCKSNVRCSAW